MKKLQAYCIVRMAAAFEPIIPVLFSVACILGWVFPAMAGNIGSELLEQADPPKRSGLAPLGSKKDVPIIEYLFIDQDELEFIDTTPLESGLMPASGEDTENLSKPEQKPVLPNYE